MQTLQKSSERIRINTKKQARLIITGSLLIFAIFYITATLKGGGWKMGVDSKKTAVVLAKKDSSTGAASTNLDTLVYIQRLAKLSNGDSSGRWPVKTAIPVPGRFYHLKELSPIMEIYILRKWAF